MGEVEEPVPGDVDTALGDHDHVLEERVQVVVPSHSYGGPVGGAARVQTEVGEHLLVPLVERHGGGLVLLDGHGVSSSLTATPRTMKSSG